MFWSGSKFHRCCYHTAKEIFERPKSRHTKLQYAVDWLCCLYAIRFYYILGIAYTNFDRAYLDWTADPICLFLYRNGHRFDKLSIAILMLLEVFNMTCQYALYNLNVNQLTWQWWHQLIVYNQDAYYHFLFSQSKITKMSKHKQRLLYQKCTSNRLVCVLIPKIFLKHYCQLYIKVTMFCHFENVNLRKLFKRKLTIMPHLSNKLRIRILFVSLMLDKLFSVIQLAVALLTGHFFVVLVPILMAPYNWHYSKVLWILLDFIVGTLSLFRMLQGALFFTGCSILGTVVYVGHLTDMYASAGEAMNQAKRKHQMHLSVLHLAIFKRQLTEHNKVCYLIIRASRDLFSTILAAFLLTNLPSNIYCIKELTFKRLPTILLLVWSAIIALQTAACAIVLGPLAKCCYVLHKPKNWITTFQLMAPGGTWLRWKLKFDDLLNRLLFGPKFAIEIALMGGVTYLMAVKFIFLYIGYILMAFNYAMESAQIESLTSYI